MHNRINDFKYNYPFVIEGYVVDTSDPDQMGRLKIWCPSLDSESYDAKNLPWAEYASPFGGVTTDFPAGRNDTVSRGHVSYGFWALPKLNAQVLVFLLNGDPRRRFYFASYFDKHRNRSLPAGRNTNPNRQPGPWTDTYEPLEPAASNLRQAFNSDLNNPIAKTRGFYEKQAAQDASVKDGKEGYGVSPADNYLDPQAYCWVTPGHHFITMNDDPDNCRIRVKTCEGNQIILDDTNERIYISTAKGNTWIELDEDGHIHIYGGASISMRADQDINLTSGRNINLNAQAGVNIKGGADLRLDSGNIFLKAGEQLVGSGCSVDLNSKVTKITGGTIDLKSEGLFAMEGSKITANTQTKPQDADKDQLILPGGPAKEASCAVEALSPSVIPTHEPFRRPANKSRNKRYKG